LYTIAFPPSGGDSSLLVGDRHHDKNFGTPGRFFFVVKAKCSAPSSTAAKKVILHLFSLDGSALAISSAPCTTKRPILDKRQETNRRFMKRTQTLTMGAFILDNNTRRMIPTKENSMMKILEQFEIMFYSLSVNTIYSQI